MRPIVFPLALLAACSNGTGPNGPLKIGIVSGNDQIAPATTTDLSAPVVGQLVRLSDGSVAWRALDGLLPAKAYAQSQTLNGSPVVGSVVCAATVGNDGLIPIVPCTSTDKNGKATFAFRHGTKAGIVKAVVQGMLNGEVATYDTAKATVTPGPIVHFGWYLSGGRDTTVTVGQVLNFETYPVRAVDAYGNVVAKSDYTFTSQRTNSDPSKSDPAPVAGWLVTVRAGDIRVSMWANGVGDSPINLHVTP